MRLIVLIRLRIGIIGKSLWMRHWTSGSISNGVSYCPVIQNGIMTQFISCYNENVVNTKLPLSSMLFFCLINEKGRNYEIQGSVTNSKLSLKSVVLKLNFPMLYQVLLPSNISYYHFEEKTFVLHHVKMLCNSNQHNYSCKPRSYVSYIHSKWRRKLILNHWQITKQIKHWFKILIAHTNKIISLIKQLFLPGLMYDIKRRQWKIKLKI